MLAFHALALLATPSGWQKQYLTDEFVDTDYSQQVYVITCIDPRDQWVQLEIMYTGSAFVLQPDYSSAYVTDASTIKVKGSNGQIYEFDFKKPHPNSFLYGITDPTQVNTLVNLLEQGNCTFSFYRPANYVKDSFNYNFRIGTQTRGIRQLAGVKVASSRKATFKGKISGKYVITMQFDQPVLVLENGGTITGTYWYGNGVNGKMKLKGTVNSRGGLDMTEYDPKGKKCGTWFVNLTCEGNNKYGLYGVMVNAKDQTYNVDLIQE